MITLDFMRLAIRSIKSRSVRSWLTVIGVLIGITAVVALISMGQGVQRAIHQQFEKIGYDLILVMPRFSGGFGGPEGEQQGRPIELSVLSQLPGIKAFAPLLTRTLPVETPKMEGFLRVTGLTAEATKEFAGYFGGFELESGRGLEVADGAARVAVLGGRAAENLGVRLGDKIRLGDQEFEVVGVLKRIGRTVQREVTQRPGGQGMAGGFQRGGMSFAFGRFRIDDAIFIPFETMQELMAQSDQLQNPGTRVSLVLVKARTAADVGAVAQRIEEELIRQGSSFNVTTVQEISQNIGNMLQGIEMALAAIAGISLLVGGVGVMNTMYTSVLERTREIGIMKAVGAKAYHILMIFLIESGLMGLVGGAIGVILGLLLGIVAISFVTRILGMALPFQAAFSPGLILGALVFSFLLGALSGVWPARKAAKLEPVEALRYE